MPRKAPELTPELTKEICENLSTGMLRGDAATLAGVERETFADWMRRGEDGEEPFAGLRQEVEKTELLAQRRLLTKISMAAANDPKVAVWMLEHRWSRGWGEKERGEPSHRLLPRASGERDPRALAQAIASNYPLLSWESSAEYQGLLTGLLAEHSPQGPTEQRLVEELAGIWWRKGRLRLAEAAAHRRELSRTLISRRSVVGAALAHVDVGEHPEWLDSAVRATEDDTAKEKAGLEEVEALTRRALELLSESKRGSYEAAKAVLFEQTREWWDEALAQDPKELGEGEKPYSADAAGLKRFIETKVLPWFSMRGQELWSRPLIREQAFGDALDPRALDNLSRHEAHLDRQMERTLATLMRLQELRLARTG
jgi:hypothetical protein